MTNFSIIQKSQLEGANRLDAEYYQPEYLNLIRDIKNFEYQSVSELGCKVVSGPFGSSLKSEAYLEKGIPFIRINDLQEFLINKDSLIYISEEDNKRLKQSQLVPGDLVLSKVGNTIGIVSIIPEEFGICNISENNIGIKFPQETPTSYKFFLLAFFNSKMGLSQVLRNISGNAQPKLNISDVQKIIFPLPSKSLLEKIKTIISDSKKMTMDSLNYYKEAENLLLEELGLKDFQIPEDLSYVINLSEIKEANRMDAEYFQPKYEKLIAKLKSQNSKLLGETISIEKGIEPGSEEYQDEGVPFIRVSNLTKQGIVDQNQKYLSEDLYQKLKNNFEPKEGEILLTKDATPGIAYVLKEPIKRIISGGILRLRIKDKVNSEYLALVLNSLVGQMQTERDTGGSVIVHWRPDQIKNCLIPILPNPTQQKIADLVQKSHEARKKSKELLEKAKRKVEEIIEKNN